MAVYTVHAGHAKQGKKYSGAAGYCYESVEDRKIKDAVIKYLRMAGHTAYDCTVDSGISQSGIITEIKRKINSHKNAAANISIHLNAATQSKSDGKTKGVECCIHSNSGKTKAIAERICSNISALGFTNRGIKVRTNLGVLKGITNGGSNILIEVFFCDDEDDVKLYNSIGSDRLGKVIAEAIINTSIKEAKTEVNKTMAEVQLYDVNGTDAQKWKVIHNKDGTISLQNKACGLMLDVEAGSTKNGAKVQVYENNGSTAQKWLIDEPKGEYVPKCITPIRITSALKKDLVLDCASGHTKNGTRIQTYAWNKTQAQQWQILDDGNGYWVIINVNSCKALDVVGGGK